MRVFVTGATGFIGSALIPELIAAGHSVLGLCRSEDKAAALVRAGAEVHRGSVEDLDSLRAGAGGVDGVVHLAFNHDFSTFVQNSEDDRRAIEALGAALAGSDRPLLVTSGTLGVMSPPGEPAMEDGPTVGPDILPRIASEQAAMALAERGGNVGVVRLGQVHDPVKQGLIQYVVALAREKGVCAYLGDGANRWPAVHVSDTARLYRLALEQAEPGARYHAVAEEGVAMRDVVGAIGRRLNLPVRSIPRDEADAYFGWLMMFASRDAPASSAKTRAALGWQPTGPSLLEDLARLELPAA